jgi:hypothetical protein
MHPGGAEVGEEAEEAVRELREEAMCGWLGWRNKATVVARGSTVDRGRARERENGGAATDERAEWEIFFSIRTDGRPRLSISVN